MVPLKPASFSRLPRRLRNRIIAQSLTYDEVQKISIDNTHEILDKLRPCLLNREILGYGATNYLRMNHIQIEMKTTQLSECLPISKHLTRLLDVLTNYGKFRPQPAHTDFWPDIEYWPSVEINLIFELTSLTDLTLEDVRFDAMSFVQTTLRWPAWRTLTISLHVSDDTGWEFSTASSVITIKQLRLNVLEVWKPLNPHAGDMVLDCPQIWVNGLGTVVEVVAAKPCLDESYVEEDDSPIIAEFMRDQVAFPKEGAPAYRTYLYLEYVCKP